uniref:Secreted mucin n=1 Tax=Anopheles atroparvus TaxID=41427 RepID=A0AAG5DME3_ANOAO
DNRLLVVPGSLCALFAVLCSVVLANPIDNPAQTVPVSEVPVTASSAEVTSATQGSDVEQTTEGSKMSRFLDDFTSAFKQSTAKMKESLESAATSVKDGVLQGYDYVRSKLTGATTEGPAATSEEPAEVGPTVASLTSTAPSENGTPSEKPTSTSTAASAPSTERPIVPNDEDDDERIIFNDKDYLAEKTPEGEDERDVTETPAATGVTIDNRFIIASPLTCKSGQEVVNGKCRNVF